MGASARISDTPSPGRMWERALDSRCDENDGVGAAKMVSDTPVPGWIWEGVLDSRCGEYDGR